MLIEILKVFLIVAILLILAYPILPFRSKAKKFSTFYALRYDPPHNKKNLPFLLLTVAEFALVGVLFGLLTKLTRSIGKISFLQSLLNRVSGQVKFDVLVLVSVVLVNFVILYFFVFGKGLLKKGIFDRVWGLTKKDRERMDRAKKKEEGQDPADGEESAGEGEESPEFLHSDAEEDGPSSNPDGEEEKGIFCKIKEFLLGIFFRAPDFTYARPWAIRTAKVLQSFVYIVEVCYFVLFALLLCAVFYPLPDVIYDILTKLIPNIFLYPFMSLIFLQEVCNFLRTEQGTVEVEKEEVEEDEEAKEQKRQAALKKLHADLIRNYAKTHKIRYYAATKAKNIPEYTATNAVYEKALDFVRKYRKQTSGHVVESYMRGVDALLNGSHVYFGASFYSELGEYLVAYTYIRLLSGERQIFVVSSRAEVESLKKFIGRRLNVLSGCSKDASWRIRDGEERLDQADILIAVPEDFQSDNMVENNPTFFANACNAIFIEADRILSLDSYLCTIIANRLRNASNREIRFVFLTTHLCQGFVKSLKKFFRTEKEIVECNSADENEDATFMLWNCESDVIYEKSGQRLESPEMLIATAAYEAGVDGIRVFSQMPMSAERIVSLRSHRVEINEIKKDVPDVNYMICVDDRCNLASAIYAYTRFRGQKASMVHILSKPYLLREFFSSTAKKYVNRSAFIKPRVTEHADEEKLMLLDLFCDATLKAEGMPVEEFISRMETIIAAVTPAGEQPVYEREKFTCDDMVKYLLDTLLGKDFNPLGEHRRINSKSFYRLSNNKNGRGYRLKETGYIAFLYVEKIFARLLSCNRRVELRLNGSLLGYLDTFPDQVCQQYVPGQSMVFQNCEYEIEKLSDVSVTQRKCDCQGEDTEVKLPSVGKKCLYLRQENVTFKNCLDTVFLRRYSLGTLLPAKDKAFPGVLKYTRGKLEEIRITALRADLVGETYGFYNQMTDSQTLDFKKGAVGNPKLDDSVIESVRRVAPGSPLLSVKLRARELECNDGMRLLLSAVLNEFIRTMFPLAYRCIAVVPVLQQPLDQRTFEDAFDHDVATLYPYLCTASDPTASFCADAQSIELLFLNDCTEDVGVLDVLYDGAARIMEELLSYAFDYLSWLKENPTLKDQSHYIYFGGESLPGVFDLDNALALLENSRRAFLGTERVKEEEEEETAQEKRCAFCHCALETGRYSRFSVNRFICISCEAEAVVDMAGVEQADKTLRKYTSKKYPSVPFATDLTLRQDGLYKLNPGEVLNEFYYKTDLESRTVLIEQDNPATNVAVSILHNLISFWQHDKGYWASEHYRIAPYLSAQMYYEELEYLSSVGREASAAWILEHLSEDQRSKIQEIRDYIAGVVTPAQGEEDPEDGSDGAENTGENGQGKQPVPAEGERTSFLFVESKIQEDQGAEGENDGARMLFDPDRVPRFWKRYLYEDPASGDQILVAGDDTEEDEEGDGFDDTEIIGGDGSDDGSGDDTASGDDSSADDGTEAGDDAGDGTEGEDPVEGDDGEADPKAPKKKKKKKTDLRTKIRHLRGIRTAMELVPYEKEEERNPRLHLYNEIARHLFDYREDDIVIPEGIQDKEEVKRIYYYVLYDYPEIFWVWGHSLSDTAFAPCYRFRRPDGTVDVPLIRRYRKELRASVNFFTKGIGKKTDPYEAFLTIYRRVILAMDYDSVALDRQKARRDREMYNEEDQLRSLHSALVKRKIVCAGYAVAMQFLLQSVGISCAQIVSETHAWNLVRFGDQRYHVDATWGDFSNTKTAEDYKDTVFYNYCCVTSKENEMCGDAARVPDRKVFPMLEELTAQKHEYFRYHDAYFTRYEEERIAKAFAEGVLRGDKAAGIRCDSEMVFQKVLSMLNNGGWSRVIEKARAVIAKKNKRLAKKFCPGSYSYQPHKSTNTIYLFWEK